MGGSGSSSSASARFQTAAPPLRPASRSGRVDVRVVPCHSQLDCDTPKQRVRALVQALRARSCQPALTPRWGSSTIFSAGCASGCGAGVGDWRCRPPGDAPTAQGHTQRAAPAPTPAPPAPSGPPAAGAAAPPPAAAHGRRARAAQQRSGRCKHRQQPEHHAPVPYPPTGCRRPQVFKKVDYNKNGLIEPLEVEVAILNMYNIVNKRLPGWQDPPTRDAIQVALKAFDDDHNGSLDEGEFERFAKSLMKSGPDTFFARVGKDAVLKTALLPAVSMGVKNGAGQVPGLEHVKDVPLAVLAPALGVGFSAIRALIPV